MSFPFGTNTCSSLRAFSWGKVRFRFGDTNEIVAVGSPMSAVPYRSRLWALETDDAFLVTRENFALNRDTYTPENDTTNAPSAVEVRLTSVKIQLTAVYDAPENHNPSRHVYGVGELVSFNVQPNSYALPYQTNEQARELLMLAIDTLVAYISRGQPAGVIMV